MKVVINTCFGGFSVSQTLLLLIVQGETWESSELEWNEYDVPRDNPVLIAALEGKIPDLDQPDGWWNGISARLKVVEIPDGIAWNLVEYDGREHIAEVHRTWT